MSGRNYDEFVKAMLGGREPSPPTDADRLRRLEGMLYELKWHLITAQNDPTLLGTAHDKLDAALKVAMVDLPSSSSTQ